MWCMHIDGYQQCLVYLARVGVTHGFSTGIVTGTGTGTGKFTRQIPVPVETGHGFLLKIYYKIYKNKNKNN